MFYTCCDLRGVPNSYRAWALSKKIEKHTSHLDLKADQLRRKLSAQVKHAFLFYEFEPIIMMRVANGTDVICKAQPRCSLRVCLT